MLIILSRICVITCNHENICSSVDLNIVIICHSHYSRTIAAVFPTPFFWLDYFFVEIQTRSKTCFSFIYFFPIRYWLAAKLPLLHWFSSKTPISQFIPRQGAKPPVKTSEEVTGAKPTVPKHGDYLKSMNQAHRKQTPLLYSRKYQLIYCHLHTCLGGGSRFPRAFAQPIQTGLKCSRGQL